MPLSAPPKPIKPVYLGFSSAVPTKLSLYAGKLRRAVVTPALAVGVNFGKNQTNWLLPTEEHWRDIFVSWFINQHVSVVAGYVDLGSIAGLAEQQGYYLAVEATW